MQETELETLLSAADGQMRNEERIVYILMRRRTTPELVLEHFSRDNF
jgi:hypothetical protein